MINTDPNMGRKQIFKELPAPSKVPEGEIIKHIYKAVFIAVKLLLDIRLNIVKVSEGKSISTRYKEGKEDNPVIKNTDNIEVKEKDKNEKII